MLNNRHKSQEEVNRLIFDEENISWKSMLMELVKTGQINPWDINISDIADKFLKILKDLNSMNFRVSGKIILASALLLKLKSESLLEEDIIALDTLLNQSDEPIELLDDLEDAFFEDSPEQKHDELKLYPKTPQPRKRKVSIYDLISALENAFEVKQRRKNYIFKQNMTIPEKKTDISELMNNIYKDIKAYFKKDTKAELNFNELLPTESKADKVLTFIPLLHLENQNKIELMQEKHFSPITIRLSG